jgi:hypothetical protein
MSREHTDIQIVGRPFTAEEMSGWEEIVKTVLPSDAGSSLDTPIEETETESYFTN